MVMILVPFYEPRNRMPDLDEETFQMKLENQRFCGPNGNPYTLIKEPYTMYENLRMVKINSYICRDKI